MRLLQTIFFTTIVMHTTLARGRRPRPNPVLGALQNILSPANTERTMQMVQFAAQRSLGNIPLPQLPMYNSPPILPYPEPQCKVPIASQPQAPTYTQITPITNPVLPCQQNQMQVQLPMPQIQMPQIPNLQAQMPVPQNLPAQIPNITPILSNLPQIPNLQAQMPVPQNLPAQIPNITPILSNLLQTPNQLTVQPNLIPQMPNLTPIQLNLQNPAPILPALQPKTPEVIIEKSCPCQRELIYPSPEPTTFLTPAQDVFSCPIPSPAALFNPGLPAASPVSTWTPENIPTAASGTRSQYLRKIPIPPPTL